MNEGSYTVYGGNGHRRIGAFGTKAEAVVYADEFETKCWDAGVDVPRCIIEETI